MPGDQKLLQANEGRPGRLNSAGAGLAKLRAHRQKITEQFGGRYPVQRGLPRATIEADRDAPGDSSRNQWHAQRSRSCLGLSGMLFTLIDGAEQRLLDE